MPSAFTIQACIILILYFILIMAFVVGWFHIPANEKRQFKNLRVSILIPLRNEAANLINLSNQLLNQDYPPELMEIILIDDQSTDDSPAILEEIIRQAPGRFIVLKTSARESGKKAALKAGMSAASGELILLTDGDSLPGLHWVATMAGHFHETGADLLLGPVLLDPADSPLRQIQKLEYMSLVSSTIGAAGIGHPIMAQGPNMAVRASDYKTMVSELVPGFASGDDVFLLQAMLKIPGKTVRVVLERDAVVLTKPAESIGAFFRQRHRWASKASGYRNFFMAAVTLIVFFANIEIVAALILAAAGIVSFSVFFALLAIKSCADLALLARAARFFNCKKLLWWLIPMQLIYPVYVSLTGIFSQLAPVRWKNPPA
jgi:cellulose synthase/poly-beta-1,6-N-acetylglucosamine synthase-like glycosyltransferase